MANMDTAAILGATGINAFANVVANDINLRKQEKMAAYTTKLQTDAQRQLMKNSAILNKEALLNAGLNPNGMSENGQLLGTASAPSPQLGNSNLSFGDIAGGVTSAINAQLIESQIKKNESESNLNNANANIQEINAETLRDKNKLDLALNEAMKKNQEIQYELNGVTLKYAAPKNEKELELLKQNIANAAETENYIKTQCQVNEQTIERMKKENEHWQENFDNLQKKIRSEIADNYASVGLKKAQAAEINKLVDEKFNLIKEQVREAHYNANDLSWKAAADMVQKELLDFNLKMNERYGDVERIAGIAGDVVGSIAGGVGIASGAKFLLQGTTSLGKAATSATKVTGFGK